MPVYSWDQIKDLTATLAKEMASRNPELYVFKMAKNIRQKKIFIDYLRNSSGATAVAPYSLRAKEFSAVALPLEWSEVEDLPSSNYFTLEKALDKIEKRRGDPWRDYLKTRQKIKLLSKR
jgi:bifunctional non-homologous end joining protein LigD